MRLIDSLMRRLLRRAPTAAQIDLNALFETGRDLAQRGDVRQAIAVYVDALRACIDSGNQPLMHGSDEIPTCLFRPNVRNDTRYEALLQIVAHELLANDVINYHADFATAHRLVGERNAFQRREFGTQDTLFLSDDWTRNLGHIGLLSYLLRLRQLGFATWSRIVVIAGARRVANPAFLRQFSPLVTWLSDAEEIADFESRTIGSGFRLLSLYEGIADRPLLLFEMVYFVAAAWEQRNSPPLLALSDKQAEQARSLRAGLGMPHDAWFVCLHAREGTFHVNPDQDSRNCRLADYLSAVEAIGRRGGWVIRMGDPAMSIAPAHSRLVDWARSPLRSDEGDVLLAGSCRFAICGNSGFAFLPAAFGRPVLSANMLMTPS